MNERKDWEEVDERWEKLRSHLNHALEDLYNTGAMVIKWLARHGLPLFFAWVGITSTATATYVKTLAGAITDASGQLQSKLDSLETEISQVSVYLSAIEEQISALRRSEEHGPARGNRPDSAASSGGTEHR